MGLKLGQEGKTEEEEGADRGELGKAGHKSKLEFM